MDPNLSPMMPPLQPESPRSGNKILLVIAGFCILCGVVATIAYYVNAAKGMAGTATFHLVSTTPALGQINTTEPSLTLVFNKPLTPSGLSVNATSNIIGTYQISGDDLILKFAGLLQPNKKYSIDFNSVYDTTGDQISGGSISFTAKYVKQQSESQTEQQQQMQQQAQALQNQPYSESNVVFTGFDSLVNAGLTADQEDGLEEAFFNYGKTVTPHVTQAAIDTTTIKQTSELSDPTQTITFTVALNNQNYQAQINYSALTTIELILDNSSGQQVFDSGNITISN